MLKNKKKTDPFHGSNTCLPKKISLFYVKIYIFQLDHFETCMTTKTKTKWNTTSVTNRRTYIKLTNTQNQNKNNIVVSHVRFLSQKSAINSWKKNQPLKRAISFPTGPAKVHIVPQNRCWHTAQQSLCTWLVFAWTPMLGTRCRVTSWCKHCALTSFCHLSNTFEVLRKVGILNLDDIKT